MSTIYILWLRQLKHYFRSRSRIISSLGQPVLFLVAFGFGFGPIFSRAGGGNYIQFIGPGIISMGIIFTAIFSGMEIIWDRQFGFLKETLVAPVLRFNIMIGRTLGGATVAAFQGILVFTMSFLVGFRPTGGFLLLPLALFFMFLIALVFASLGTAIASVLEDMQAFPLIMSFLVMPLFFLSGAIFPIDGVPGAIAVIARFNPLTYGVDALRGALINSSVFGLGHDFTVLALVSILFLWIGSWPFSKIQV